MECFGVLLLLFRNDYLSKVFFIVMIGCYIMFVCLYKGFLWEIILVVIIFKFLVIVY